MGMNIELLMQYGIDYNKGKSRFLGDTELYESVLKSFLDDVILERSEQAMKNKDYNTLFECVHELKGACGNVDMFELFEITSAMVEYLRLGNYEEEKIQEYFSEMKRIYLNSQEGIRLACKGE